MTTTANASKTQPLKLNVSQMIWFHVLEVQWSFWFFDFMDLNFTYKLDFKYFCLVTNFYVLKKTQFYVFV